VDKVKQKLKDEKNAHQSTEFRLKVRCFEGLSFHPSPLPSLNINIVSTIYRPKLIY
jgi:hypothetical protein